METDPKKIFWRALAYNPFLMVALKGSGAHSVPMTAILDEDIQPEAIWFFTTKENRLAAGGAAMAQFVSREQDVFACLSGIITPDNDPHVITRLWSSSVAEWYEKGRDDPAIQLLRLTPDDIEIWAAAADNKGWFKRMTHDDIAEGRAWRHVDEALQGPRGTVQ